MAATAIFGLQNVVIMWTPPFGAMIPICDVNNRWHKNLENDAVAVTALSRIDLTTFCIVQELWQSSFTRQWNQLQHKWLFSLKIMDRMGLQPIFEATPLYSMREKWPASSQRWGCINTDAQCKLAFTYCSWNSKLRTTLRVGSNLSWYREYRGLFPPVNRDHPPWKSYVIRFRKSTFLYR